jgi:hypothetical protein
VCEDNLEIVLAVVVGYAFGRKCALEYLHSISRFKKEIALPKDSIGG